MDKKPLIVKCLAVVIILLFVATGIIPSTALDTGKPLPTSKGNWLYVGGSGPGNYSVIQDAVDNASDGDTVFVYSGIYNDYFPSGQWGNCVLVNKRINLIGENKYTTMINASGGWTVVRIQNDGVNISGFTIENSGGVFENGGVVVMDWYDYINIYDNIFVNNNYGINLNSWNSHVMIYNNTIAFNGIGINIYDNTECSIFNNKIFNNTKGITNIYGDEKSSISSNNIQNNILGVQMDNSRFIVQNNNFISNQNDTQMNKISYIREIPYIPFVRMKWMNNYWDTWETTNPRPIKGTIFLFIELFFAGSFFDMFLVKIPYRQYDLHPAQEPYDILGIT